MKKKTKLLIIIPSITVSVLILSVAVPFTILGIKTNSIKNDYDYLKYDSSYNTKVEVTGVDLVKQHISCGYATIEMMSSYYGSKVSEDDLSKKNGGNITTSSSNGFLKEINSSITNHKFIKKSYLKNDELLKTMHNSLLNENPLAIEWAAKYENEWTLHFSLVSGMDLSNDIIIIYNPYGYIENISVDEFISRTTFKTYKNMPLFLNFGFAFGAFEKNTVFYANN